MTEYWQNQVALVTGASRGIGKSIALTLGRLGVKVVGTATTEAGAERISAYFEEAGLTGVGMALDVTQSEQVSNTLKQIESVYGPVSLLVNNAGITQDGLLMKMSEDQWQSVIDTNLTAIFRLSKACIRGMMKKRFGRIVTIGSVIGRQGNPGQANYAAAKAGLEGFSRALAIEIAARNITANVVAPGFIETDMTAKLDDAQQAQILSHIPMKRMGQTQEIAAAVEYFCSEQAAYVTGAVLPVNGGMFFH